MLYSVNLFANIDEIKQSASLSGSEKQSRILDYLLNTLDSKEFDANKYLREAEELEKSKTDDSIKIKILLLKGKVFHNMGLYPKAIASLTDALRISESTGDKQNIVECFRSLGESYRVVGLYETSLSNLNKSLELSNNSNDSSKISSIYNRLAAVYYESGDNDNAIKYVRTSNKYADSSQKGAAITANNYNILSAIYLNDKDYYNAQLYAEKALRTCDEKGLESIKPNILINLAVINFRQSKYKEALSFSKNALEISEKLGIKSYIPLAARIASSSYYELGNFKEAYKFLKISGQVRDSLVSEKTNQQILEIRTKYETEDKEKELKNQKEKSLYQNAIFAAILIVVALVIVIIVNRYKILSTRNKELKGKNEIITYQNDQLSELNATKDKFFSIIAHDLKNPLGNLKQMTNLLSESFAEFSEDDKLEFINLMNDSSKNIYNLLENLLEWSRSQRGIISFNPVEVSVKILLIDLLKMLKPLALKKSITIDNNISMSLSVTADPNMLQTILRNLLSNAIKFTKKGGKIEIESKPDEDNNFVCIFIKDNGIGINDTLKSQLFKIDEKVSRPGTDDEPSTGLGLILCKEFVEKHGGRIWVESIESEGSTFYFTIPIKSDIGM